MFQFTDKRCRGSRLRHGRRRRRDHGDKPARRPAGSLHYGITIGASNSVLRIGSHRHGRWSHGRRSHYRRDRCTVRHAIRKARRLGIHRSHLARANHRRIVVRGRRHGLSSPDRLCQPSSLPGYPLSSIRKTGSAAAVDLN